MQHIQLFENFSTEPVKSVRTKVINEAAPTESNKVVDAYDAFLSVVSIFDGYMSEYGLTKNDKYWGDAIALNDELDKVTANTRTANDVKAIWDNMIKVAAKILDGIEGVVSEQGSVGRYGKMSDVTKAKKLLNL